jgi:hypothetical protein
MKAALLREIGKPLVIEEVPDPKRLPLTVLVFPLTGLGLGVGSLASPTLHGLQSSLTP